MKVGAAAEPVPDAVPDVKQHLARLSRSTVIYGLGSVIPRFIGLLLLPVFTSYLRPDEYGVLAMLGVLAMIAQPIFALGISVAMGPSYFESDNQDTRAQTLWTAFGILAASSTVLLLCGWLLPHQLGTLVLLPAGNADLVSLTLTGCALGILAVPFQQWLQFEERAGLFVGITLAAALTVSAASVVMVAWLGLGAKGMILAQLLGNLLGFVAFLLVALQKTRPQLNRAIHRELLRLGVRMVPSVGLLFVLMHSNKYFLQWMGGLEQTGIYSVGFNIATVISFVVSSIATAWYPFFMSFMQKPAEAEVLFGKIFTYYVFGVGYLSLLFFVFAKPVVMSMAEQRYWDAHSVIGLVSLAYFFSGIFNLLLPGFYYAREISFVTIIQGAAALVSLPLNYLLVFHWGMVGAAYGVAASHLIMAVLAYLWNLHRANNYPKIRYEWARISLFVLGGLLLAAVTLVDRSDTLGRELIRSLLLGLLATVLVVGCLNQRERLAIVAKLKLFSHAAS